MNISKSESFLPFDKLDVHMSVFIFWHLMSYFFLAGSGFQTTGSCLCLWSLGTNKGNKLCSVSYERDAGRSTWRGPRAGSERIVRVLSSAPSGIRHLFICLMFWCWFCRKTCSRPAEVYRKVTEKHRRSMHMWLFQSDMCQKVSEKLTCVSDFTIMINGFSLSRLCRTSELIFFIEPNSAGKLKPAETWWDFVPTDVWICVNSCRRISEVGDWTVSVLEPSDGNTLKQEGHLCWWNWSRQRETLSQVSPINMKWTGFHFMVSQNHFRTGDNWN